MSASRAGLFFDELAVGQSWHSARFSVTEEAIISFAFTWDPQPFHIDRIGAQNSVFGGLVASGLHTFMLSYRLYYDQGILAGTALAGLGVDDMRFQRPLRPGDTVRVETEILETRPTSKSDRGVVRLRLKTTNQDEAQIFGCIISALVARRVTAS